MYCLFSASSHYEFHEERDLYPFDMNQCINDDVFPAPRTVCGIEYTLKNDLLNEQIYGMLKKGERKDN